MSTLTGTRHVARLILRRDRVLLPLWVLLLAVLPATYAASFFELFPTEAERAAYAAGTARNPSIVALLGPAYGDSIGALTAQRSGFLLVIIALASLLTVIRHTRTEEEAGRRELLGATVLGRHAGLTAALLVTYAADLLLGLVTVAGLVASGLPAAGSCAYGLATVLTGIVFATIGGLAAQLTETAGGARGIGIAVLGAAFGLRLVGDTATHDWPSWLSPLGWAARVRAYEGDRWWVLALPLAATVLLAAVAYPVSVRRDLGAGLLPPRLGPATAGRALSGAFGLAWRLHRGQILWWSVGFGLLGLILGGAAQAAGRSMEGNAQLEEIMARIGGASGLADAYLGATLSLAGLAAAGYGVQAALRMRSEETDGRAEPLLVTGTHRSTWLLSHVVFALLGPVVVLAVTGLAIGLTYGLSVHDVPRELPRMVGAGLAQVPAAWVLAGLAVLLYGLLPRLASVAWAILAVCVLLGQLGAVLKLSQWLLDVSPFTHTPQVLRPQWSATPFWVLAAVALVAAAAGLAAFRRRDVPVT
ncbi:ABC transporter permease [Micromonospora narathiwatensis]|uniref:ABC-2 type transport system permease protein n=1 Tax=Micromonospora narathiwatensis TaxID=299146 RepID=A0A1A9ACL6_9ACTN|nr:ABC transporter permease [Micromonospora narathiwatensis]SBT53857.1 ABC-2 type transport system permease protein [Micromonospora narathiwatensis]